MLDPRAISRVIAMYAGGVGGPGAVTLLAQRGHHGQPQAVARQLDQLGGELAGFASSITSSVAGFLPFLALLVFTRHPGFAAALRQSMHAADVARLLGHADHAARIQQIEQAALMH
jgi:hypothetical protein